MPLLSLGFIFRPTGSLHSVHPRICVMVWCQHTVKNSIRFLLQERYVGVSPLHCITGPLVLKEILVGDCLFVVLLANQLDLLLLHTSFIRISFC